MNDYRNPLIPFMAAFEGKEMRIVDENGDHWFVAKDVCEILELSNHRKATQNLDDDERGSLIVTTLGGPQEMIVISIPGLLSFVGKSRVPIARKLDRELRHVILPQIIRTGSYGTPQPHKIEMTGKDFIELHRSFLNHMQGLDKETNPEKLDTRWQALNQVCRRMNIDTPPLKSFLPQRPQTDLTLELFWEAIEDLENQNIRVNHSPHSSLLAVSMPHFRRLVRDHGLDFELTPQMRHALKHATDPEFVAYKNVRSCLFDKPVRCWVFARTPEAE
ncbi:Bro-N domain-containing protein [Terasakiella pusilla]|uniref:BRO-N domain-containing protein n=1 Tax=Terasakiella pusilla TaxID=64973 RepID=UPI003AA8DEF8